MDFNKLEDLEERINALLNKTTSLAQRNKLLEETLMVAQGEQVAAQTLLDETEAKLAVMQTENEAIVGRIDSLLERLENI